MTARQLALRVLFEIDQNGAYSSMELKKQLAACNLAEADRAFASELVYGVVKNRTRLDFVIAHYSSVRLKKLSVWILNILRMGVYQLLLLDKVPPSAAVNEAVKLAKRYGHGGSAGFVNAVLRSAARGGDVQYPQGRAYWEVYYSHPRWLVDLLFEQYGGEAEQIIAENNKTAPAVVRPNPLRCTAADLTEQLEQQGVTVRETEEDGLLVIEKYGAVAQLAAYKNGLLTVQNASSYLAAKALEPRPGKVLVDLCAAPGGKTTALAELCGGEGTIYAFELHAHRAALIEENVRRLGLCGVQVRTGDARQVQPDLEGCADGVLVDAPCSGLGIIRKKPDVRWNRRPEELAELTLIQRQLLRAAARYVKPGGLLVYSTCTLNKQENEEVAAGFAAEAGFDILWERTILPHGIYDGFYICKLQRREG